MSIDPGDLGGNIRTDAKRPAGDVIREFESLQIEVATGASEQRIQVFDKRWKYQFISPAAIEIDEFLRNRSNSLACGGRVSLIPSGSNQYFFCHLSELVYEVQGDHTEHHADQTTQPE